MAKLSADGRHRYLLGRRWSTAGLATFVMLNPSTADAEVDDPTIRKVMGFARRWGLGGITVVNLYSVRSSSPIECLRAEDRVGPEADRYLRTALSSAAQRGAPVIAAWGTLAEDARVDWLLQQPGCERLEALHITKDGHPGHPLYLPATSARQPWPLSRRRAPSFRPPSGNARDVMCRADGCGAAAGDSCSEGVGSRRRWISTYHQRRWDDWRAAGAVAIRKA